MTTMQLFCVPHAGGSANAFMPWRKLLPAEVDVRPIELAGRGPRLGEPPAVDARVAAADVAQKILAERRDDVPYAIWGHSMGALIAYETYYAIAERTGDLPGHMVFSGRTAPHSPREATDLYRIADDDAFIAAVESYGGGTQDALRDPDLRALFLPVLRADFELSESYRWTPREDRMSCPVTVVNGDRDDSFDTGRLADWSELAAGPVDHRTAEGNHFFLYANQGIVRSVIDDVRAALAGNTAAAVAIGGNLS